MTQEEAEKRIKELCQYPIPDGFLEAEERNGYLVSAKMKRVWAVQLELLKKLLEVCQKHNLRIWADGGTLIGAVREHGYIPWDDDIDMRMLRPDYDKLVSIAQQEFNHPYFFQCGYTEKYYSRGHAQLRMDGTSAMAAHPSLLGIHHGIFIDIFPLDAVPDDGQMLMKHIEKLKQLQNKIMQSWCFDILHPIRSLTLIKYLNNTGKLHSDFENHLRKYSIDDFKNVSSLSFSTDIERYMNDKHWYDETLYLPFENIMMPVPSGYDEILKKLFGDYMKPVQEASCHGGFWKLDAETDYRDCLPEFEKVCKVKKRQWYKQRLLRMLKK